MQRFHLDRLPQYEPTKNGLLIRAPAKINLGLLIAGKREDGFHDLESIMCTITLYDEILIEAIPGHDIELSCTGAYWAPENQDNLVYKSAKMFCSQFNIHQGFRITLKKQIPAGSGLGSASSDAASTLLGLNRITEIHKTIQELEPLAATLGSDVSFFLHGPLAFCSGRGEVVRKMEAIDDFDVVLILPNLNVSTAAVYKHYNHNPEQFQHLRNIFQHLIHKKRVDLIPEMCTNMLQESCFNQFPELEKLKLEIESSGIGPLCLSGSGSTLFCLNKQNKIQDASIVSRTNVDLISYEIVWAKNNVW